jgi:acyl-lipid omega-6 desaturase (Delta-12 desaturase)
VTAASKPRRAQEGPSNWRQIVAQYQNPDVRRAVGQILTSVVALLAMMVVMYFSLRVSYWLTLLLAIPTAGFMLRTFIVFHDCGHGSFFANRKANDVVGMITGVLTFTPYYRWRHAHAVHHATAGDLDRREMGDIWTLTVDEYLDAPRWKRIAYRLYRNPLIIFTVGAWLSFLVLQRFPNFKDGKRERNSILWTDLALLLIFVVAGLTIGLGDFLLVVLPVMILGTSVGVWLFYVQHQFEGVYWERHKQWSYVDAALKGSSFYQLPRVLQWFSGNIGFHHIHHLSPRIPNYNLEQAYSENELFHIQPVTLRSGMRSLKFRLYDEENHRLVGFGYVKEARQLRAARAPSAQPSA